MQKVDYQHTEKGCNTDEWSVIQVAKTFTQAPILP